MQRGLVLRACVFNYDGEADMTELFRSVILGVTVAALFGGIAMTLVHTGTMKEVVRLAAGVMVILSLLMPLSQVRLRLPTDWIHASTQPIDRQVEQATTQSREWRAQASAREIGAYLTRRASGEGITCNIEVQASIQDDGVVLLDGATIRGTLSAAEREQVYRLLETECGIPRERQAYVED